MNVYQARAAYRRLNEEPSHYREKVMAMVSGNSISIDFATLENYEQEVSRLQQDIAGWKRTLDRIARRSGKEYREDRREAKALRSEFCRLEDTLQLVKTNIRRTGEAFRGADREVELKAGRIELPLQKLNIAAPSITDQGSKAPIIKNVGFFEKEEEIEYELMTIEEWLAKLDVTLAEKGGDWSEIRCILIKNPSEVTPEEMKKAVDFLLSIEDPGDLYLLGLCGLVADPPPFTTLTMASSETFKTVLVAAELVALEEYKEDSPATMNNNDYSDIHLQTYLRRIMKVEGIRTTFEAPFVPYFYDAMTPDLEKDMFMQEFLYEWSDSSKNNSHFPDTLIIQEFSLSPLFPLVAFSMNYSKSIEYMGYGEITLATVANSKKWQADKNLLQVFMEESGSTIFGTGVDLVTGEVPVVGTIFSAVISYTQVIKDRNERDWKFIASNLDLHILEKKRYFTSEESVQIVVPSKSTLNKINSINQGIDSLKSEYSSDTAISIQGDSLKTIIRYDTEPTGWEKFFGDERDTNPYFELNKLSNGDYVLSELKHITLEDIQAYPGMVDEYLELIIQLEIK